MRAHAQVCALERVEADLDVFMEEAQAMTLYRCARAIAAMDAVVLSIPHPAGAGYVAHEAYACGQGM